MKINYINDSTLKKWKKIFDTEIKCFYAGETQYAIDIIKYFSDRNFKEIKNYLKKKSSFFSIVCIGKNTSFIYVDHIRSYPLFYTKNKKKYIFSNSVYKLIKNIKRIDIKDDRLTQQFFNCSYTLNDRTLFRDIRQLNPGELMYVDGQEFIKEKNFYLKFKKKKLDIKTIEKGLDEILNKVFIKIIRRNRNKKIFIPLSGGLDSRLVLSKLIELGAKNISCFSYGNPYNSDATKAKKIANRLRVDWKFIDTTKENSELFYNSNIRTKYSLMASNFQSIPSYLDFQAIYLMKKKKIINHNSIIINGQTGDFLSGGHLPKIKKKITKDLLLNSIHKRYFRLWLDKSNKNKENDFNSIEETLSYSSININQPLNKEKFYFLFYFWEWFERQCKYVCNGQRVYDYFNLDWELPFWDKKYLNFWNSVPSKYLINQSLYKSYLLKYDYKKVFSDFNTTRHTWPNNKLWIIVIANILKIILGQKFKISFYNKMSYHSSYNYVYRLFGKEFYKKNYKSSRSPESFISKKFLEEGKFI